MLVDEGNNSKLVTGLLNECARTFIAEQVQTQIDQSTVALEERFAKIP